MLPLLSLTVSHKLVNSLSLKVNFRGLESNHILLLQIRSVSPRVISHRTNSKYQQYHGASLAPQKIQSYVGEIFCMDNPRHHRICVFHLRNANPYEATTYPTM